MDHCIESQGESPSEEQQPRRLTNVIPPEQVVLWSTRCYPKSIRCIEMWTFNHSYIDVAALDSGPLHKPAEGFYPTMLSDIYTTSLLLIRLYVQKPYLPS